MKEKDYLYSQIQEFSYDEEFIRIMWDDNKYVNGIVTGKGNNTTISSKMIDYNVLYKTLIRLNKSIKFSFLEAIDILYENEKFEKFNPMLAESNELFVCNYFIENAIYRVVSLWDILAQFYVLNYNLPYEKNKINYKKVLNNDNFKVKKTNNEELITKVKEIKEYIFESVPNDQVDSEGKWVGNHSYLTDYRNAMVHRNSPNETVFSNYDINFRRHPLYVLKIATEDFNTVNYYIKDILEKIIKSLDCDFKDEHLYRSNKKQE